MSARGVRARPAGGRAVRGWLRAPQGVAAAARAARASGSFFKELLRNAFRAFFHHQGPGRGRRLELVVLSYSIRRRQANAYKSASLHFERSRMKVGAMLVRFFCYTLYLNDRNPLLLYVRCGPAPCFSCTVARIKVQSSRLAPKTSLRVWLLCCVTSPRGLRNQVAAGTAQRGQRAALAVPGLLFRGGRSRPERER